jgi:hypothetical protein
MKNIHLIETNKPSRIHKIGNELGYTNTPNSNFLAKQQNIYITSDEEIEVDWCIITDIESVLYGQFEKHRGTHQRNDQWKKIILTTDSDLIADGIQSIDDNFLEWFVFKANDSGKPIDVIVVESKDFNYDKEYWYTYYKIIIPKEEVKEEKLYTEKEVIEIVEKSRKTGLTAEYLIENFKKK